MKCSEEILYLNEKQTKICNRSIANNLKNIAFQVILNTYCDCKIKLLRSMQVSCLVPPGEPFPRKTIYCVWSNSQGKNF